MSKVIADLEDRAMKDEQEVEAGVKKEELVDFSDSEFAEVDEVMEAEEADLARDVNLPSNMDSKLWRINVFKAYDWVITKNQYETGLDAYK